MTQKRLFCKIKQRCDDELVLENNEVYRLDSSRKPLLDLWKDFADDFIADGKIAYVEINNDLITFLIHAQDEIIRSRPRLNEDGRYSVSLLPHACLYYINLNRDNGQTTLDAFAKNGRIRIAIEPRHHEILHAVQIP